MKHIFTLLFAGLVFAGGWWDRAEAVVPPLERIQGTWTIDKITAFGLELDEGLGTIDFENCDRSDCRNFFSIQGAKQDQFTYSLDEEGTQLVIKDNSKSQEDSDYSGTYAITEFTNNSLKISTETILGNLDYEMSK